MASKGMKERDFTEFWIKKGKEAFKQGLKLNKSDELPLTNVGKIEKKGLREKIAGKLRDEVEGQKVRRNFFSRLSFEA